MAKKIDPNDLITMPGNRRPARDEYGRRQEDEETPGSALTSAIFGMLAGVGFGVGVVIWLLIVGQGGWAWIGVALAIVFGWAGVVSIIHARRAAEYDKRHPPEPPYYESFSKVNVE